MITERISVTGMSCNHCTASVTNALAACHGVSEVSVSLEDKSATVTYDEAVLSRAELISVIEDLGFEAE